jgi:hypothetical protein
MNFNSPSLLFRYRFLMSPYHHDFPLHPYFDIMITTIDKLISVV